MRKLLFVLCVLITKNTLAQLPLPCTFYTNSNSAQFSSFSGYKETPCLTFDFWQGDFGLADENFRFYSTEIGEVHQNFSFDASNGGELHISSGNVISTLEGAWIYPIENYIVPMYTKVEWGIKLPDPIQQEVNEWIANQALTTSVVMEGINPFDPEELDVWAEISIGGISQRINGFFFIEMSRLDQADIDVNDWNWIDLETPYCFRVRFSPDQLGSYSVKIKCSSPEFGIYETSEFQFDSAWNYSDKSYIKTSPNGHYLSYMNNDVFYPIGMNITEMLFNCACDESIVLSGNCENCRSFVENDPCCGLLPAHRRGLYNGDSNFQLGSELREKALPMASYKNFQIRMNELAQAGANSFKMMMHPAYFDVEFEKLTNYYDRQYQAWEMDEIIDLASDLNLKIQFDMQMQTTLCMNTFGASRWDWSNTLDFAQDGYNPQDMGYCYWREFNLDPNNPIDFYSSTEARDAYKKKLRYIIARWGYSTSIYLWELYSEINGTGSGDYFSYDDNNENGYFDDGDVKHDGMFWPRPYDSIPHIVRPLLRDWTFEMSNYLKEDLGTKQLLTVAYAGKGPFSLGKYEGNLSDYFQDYLPYYTGIPEIPSYWSEGDDQNEMLPQLTFFDNSWQHPNIDVIAWSEYSDQLDRYQMYSQLNYSEHNFLSNAKDFYQLTKPILHAETGTHHFSECNYTSFVKDIITLPFSGCASGGMSWEEHYNNDEWHWLGSTAQFLENNFFNTTNIGATGQLWEPKYLTGEEQGIFDENSLPKLESVYLHNNTENKCIGVVLNRTWNWYSINDDNIGRDDCLNQPEAAQSSNMIEEFKSFVSLAHNDYNVRIPNMGSSNYYRIKYFDVQTGIELGSELKMSGVTGQLNLEDFPELSLSHPFFFFKIYPEPLFGNEEQFSRLEQNISGKNYNFEKSSTEGFDDFTLYPNPADNVLYVESLMELGSIKVINTEGQVVFEQVCPSNTMKIEVTGLSSGIYSIFVGNMEKPARFVVVH